MMTFFFGVSFVAIDISIDLADTFPDPFFPTCDDLGLSPATPSPTTILPSQRRLQGQSPPLPDGEMPSRGVLL
jgi:hypothetical protein